MSEIFSNGTLNNNQSINQSSQAGNAGPMFEDSIHTSEFRKGARVKHQFCQNWIDFSLTLQIRINKNRVIYNVINFTN